MLELKKEAFQTIDATDVPKFKESGIIKCVYKFSMRDHVFSIYSFYPLLLQCYLSLSLLLQCHLSLSRRLVYTDVPACPFSSGDHLILLWRVC